MSNTVSQTHLKFVVNASHLRLISLMLELDGPDWGVAEAVPEADHPSRINTIIRRMQTTQSNTFQSSSFLNNPNW